MNKIKKKYESPDLDIEKFYIMNVISTSTQDDYDDEESDDDDSNGTNGLQSLF